MAGISHASGVTVSDLNNGATSSGLAESLAGGGVSVSNVLYTGSNRGAGMFTGGASSIGFDSGIVLDSGNVQTYATDGACSRGVEGPNTCYESTEGKAVGPSGEDNSTAFGQLGDSQLTELSGFPTHDASILEFDFVPQHSTVQFSYVFGSEEYSDYANTQYNDVFGFYVNGANCALVPGTAEPVSINTINNGNDASGDTTPHHPELFRDNVRPEPTIDSQMDGLTTVLTCTATVKEGETNHLKLAIADSSDEALDTAVFIQAKSLVSGTQISTSLSGAGKSGEKITVPGATAVSDHGVLSGSNAPSATGTVTYKVYSDNECKTLLTDAGEVTVTGGSVPVSTPETFSPGVYYWQAKYSGDANNNASTSACGDEVETVEEPASGPTPTTLTTSLSGGGKSGATITVPEGTAATDGATLSGEHAATATGTVSYKVYSNSECTTEVASAGEQAVTGGAVPPSSPETLSPGTYYWQAAYAGDANNEGSKSTCGSEIETVTAVVPPEECHTAIGAATVVIRKEGESERQKVTNKLSTNLTSKEKLTFTWESGASKLTLTKLTSASCTVKANGTRRFLGKGQATVNGEPGWGVTFYFTLSKTNSFAFHVRVSKPKEEALAFTDRAAMLTSEKIS